MNDARISKFDRREFLRTSAAGIGVLTCFNLGIAQRKIGMKKTRVALIKTSDRKKAVGEAFRLLDYPRMKEKKVFIKPNFNTADPAPASTHNDVLTQIILETKKKGASGITVGERSGPPQTQKVLEEKGIPDLARELGFEVINFEDLKEEDWVNFNPAGNHWAEGFSAARPAVEAEYSIAACCLKTHQHGGVFTMALKLAVGLTPKRLMRELHRSQDMRKMIAEINLAYKPKLILLDGVEAFVDGGPSSGNKVQADVFIAGTDRIAVDAVGLAVLKELGSNSAVMDTRIFEQEQIKRAVELGLGIEGQKQIEFVTPDKTSRLYAAKLKGILLQG